MIKEEKYKLLIVCPRVPWPANDGGALAMVHFVKCYTQLGYDVDIVCFNTTKHFASKNQIESFKSFTLASNVYTVALNTKIKLGAALFNLFFQKQSYNLKRFFNQSFEHKIKKLIQINEYKFIHIESLFAATFLPNLLPIISVPIVLRTHNIEYQIWERLAENSKNPFKKYYLNLMAKRLKMEELSITGLVHHFFHIAQTDMNYFELVFPASTHFLIPYAMQLPSIQKELSDEMQVAFIGSMEWTPNKDGLDWFLKNVWPIVLGELPQAKLHIAGKSLNKQFVTNTNLNVFVHGQVQDALLFLNMHQLLVVPLFAGSGIRVKIIEALSIGLPVVTTSIGAQGLNLSDSYGLFIANDAQNFASQIVYVLQNPESVHDCANNGRNYVLDTFEENAVSVKLEKALNTILNSNSV